VVIGALVVLLAAGLASVSPPGPDEALASQPEVLTVTGADFGTSVRARLEVDPGFAGLNGFNLSLRDYDSGEPIHAQVTLRFSFLDGSLPVSELKLTHEGSGRYAAEGANLSLDGRWRVTVVVQEASGSVEVPLELATRCDAQRLAEPGRRPIWILELDDDNTVQTYLDPGTPGHNDVHLTFFAPDGTELKVAKSPVVTASTEDGNQVALEISRFSRGHFVATGNFGAGTWRVGMSATIDGRVQSACFEEAIE
jgi:nitrogen fixation protein FixH